MERAPRAVLLIALQLNLGVSLTERHFNESRSGAGCSFAGGQRKIDVHNQSSGPINRVQHAVAELQPFINWRSTMFRKLLVIATLSVPTAAFGQIATAAPRSPDIRSTINSLEKQMWAHWKNREFGEMKALMAVDARFVGGNKVQNRDQLTEELKKSDCAVKSVTMNDVNVSVVSPTVAIITYKSVLDGICNGKPVDSGGDLNTSVWARRDGSWRTVLHHQSPAIE